jgi:hypothetical protein
MKSYKNLAKRVIALALLVNFSAPTMADPVYKYRLLNLGGKAVTGGTGSGTGAGTGSGGTGSGTGSGGTTTPAEPPVNILSSFTLLRGGIALIRNTTNYQGYVRLTNNTGQPLTGPFNYAVADLPANVTLENLTGMYKGVPYITLPNSTIAAGEQVQFNTIFGNPTKVGVSYTPIVYKGAL